MDPPQIFWLYVIPDINCHSFSLPTDFILPSKCWGVSHLFQFKLILVTYYSWNMHKTQNLLKELTLKGTDFKFSIMLKPHVIDVQG